MNKYYVIEIQTNEETSANRVTAFEDRNTAEDEFCHAVEAANDSQVLVHTVMWIDARGKYVEPPKSYTHPAQTPATEEQPAEE